MNIQLFIGFPPTVNHYYTKTKRGIFISKKGRLFREAVGLAVNEQLGGMEALVERLEVTVILSPPDKRTRDLDNYMKALLDALTHAGVWEDDSQIDQLLVYRARVKKGGSTTIVISDAGPVMSDDHLLVVAQA